MYFIIVDTLTHWKLNIVIKLFDKQVKTTFKQSWTSTVGFIMWKTCVITTFFDCVVHYVKVSILISIYSLGAFNVKKTFHGNKGFTS